MVAVGVTATHCERDPAVGAAGQADGRRWRRQPLHLHPVVEHDDVAAVGVDDEQPFICRPHLRDTVDGAMGEGGNEGDSGRDHCQAQDGDGGSAQMSVHTGHYREPLSFR